MYFCGNYPLIDIIIWVVVIIQTLMWTSVCGFINVSTAELHNCEDSCKAWKCENCWKKYLTFEVLGPTYSEVFLWTICRLRSRDRLGSKVTQLQVGWSRVQIMAGARFCSFPQCLDLCWGPPNPLFSGHPWFLFSGQSSRFIGLATHLHLLPRLRMSRPVCLHLLCSFMACIGAAFFIRQITDRQKTNVLETWSLLVTRIDAADV
jgi:hypothetical protein